MTTLTLAKHHGLGNDFLILLDLDASTPIDAGLARALCDRHRGVGADGLIRVTRGGGGEARLTFELRNADGSMAEMSGNGMRCLGQAALDAGLVEAGQPFVVDSAAGLRTVTVRPGDGPTGAWASVEMGRAIIDGGDGERCNVGHGQLRVNLGNPHLVVLGPDPAVVAVGDLGPALEKRVPGGQNVEFVALGPGPDEITMRVWERGVGETAACGTGACAAAVALWHWGRVGRRVMVHQPGGDADVELRADGTVVLSGPTQRVAVCLVELDDAGSGSVARSGVGAGSGLGAEPGAGAGFRE
ncbi:MAG: diaminopimelate epimerase [Acidimicrobiaceae bacterium]|jgi:diaminopimelate epimerase|nr:diaminopimelate epimerase [Acidimicrobiaceae bacterium]